MEQENKNQDAARLTQNNVYMISAAIILAGVLIAGAVFYSSKSKSPGGDNFVAQVSQKRAETDGAAINVKPVTNRDHIFGNSDAAVKIIEFSDVECPFCKRFHSTMKQVMDEYGKNGQVAWVYRHFPLDAIHSKARKEAEATECAGELGGNIKFWEYIDRLFEITPSNNQLALDQLPEIAAYVGLNKTRFSQCLDSGKYAERVADDLADALNSGGNGTPWSIVIAPNDKKFPLNGAQPYSAVKALIETALQEK